MNISAKTEYACLALMELSASYGSGEPVRIRKIADRHGIPSQFLVQILLQLKGAGMVSSTRGASGGYELIRDPQEITLADVFSVIEGGVEQHSSSAGVETPACRVLSDAWTEIASVQRSMLESTTLAELLDRAKGQAEPMYYI